jgi:hypothetical protein
MGFIAALDLGSYGGLCMSRQDEYARGNSGSTDSIPTASETEFFDSHLSDRIVSRAEQQNVAHGVSRGNKCDCNAPSPGRGGTKSPTHN